MKFKNPLLLVFLSWLVSALTIIGIALVISPDSYVDGFWYRVAWTEFLNVLFWLGNSGWFIENKNNSGMAVTPAINFFTSLYCIISFVLMLAFYEEESLYGMNKAHEIIQIIMFGVYALMMIRLQLAVHFADKDLLVSEKASISPLDLGQKIKKFENNCPKDVAKELKRLREKITYSLQNNNRIRTNEKYEKFVKNITNKIENNHISMKDIKDFMLTIDDLIHVTKRD